MREGERPREPKHLQKTGLAGTLALPTAQFSVYGKVSPTA